MLTIFFNGRRRQYRDIEHAKQVLRLHEIIDPDGLVARATRRVEPLFVGIDPYMAEMSSGEPEPKKYGLVAASAEELERLVNIRLMEV